MKMGGNRDNLDTIKRNQIFLAKMYGIQLMVQNKSNASEEQQQIMKLKSTELKEIVEQCHDYVIEPEHKKLRDKVQSVVLLHKRGKEDNDGEGQ